MTAECCSCERVKPVFSRGLCRTCYRRLQYRRDGSLEEFGYLKADRVDDFAAMRGAGESITRAAARLGVTARTAQRYESELAAARKAPWRPRSAGPSGSEGGSGVNGSDDKGGNR